MKLYNQYLKASISMSDDLRLKKALRKLFLENSINFLIETGTYLGTGSTKVIAESFPQNKKPKKFYTIEMNYNSYKQAVKNLKKFDFVKVLWGNSVFIKDALNFIRNDEAIFNHGKYSNIFIDDIENPVKFYEKEIKGKFNSNPNQTQTFRPYLRNIFLKPRENLLKKLLNTYKDQKCLIILDSAGGIGYLEYKIVKENMNEKIYWLLFDDIHHLKHFRSFAEIKSNSDFKIIDYSLECGWLLAKHNSNCTD